MSYLVRAAPREHFGWLVERTGLTPTTDMRAIEAVDAHGQIRGMVAYTSWTPNSAHVHIALDSPAAGRALLVPAFEYPFQQAGKGILLGVIPAHNRRSLQNARRLGFRETHRVRDGWDAGVDLIVFELRKAECRFLHAARKAA